MDKFFFRCELDIPHFCQIFFLFLRTLSLYLLLSPPVVSLSLPLSLLPLSLALPLLLSLYLPFFSQSPRLLLLCPLPSVTSFSRMSLSSFHVSISEQFLIEFIHHKLVWNGERPIQEHRVTQETREYQLDSSAYTPPFRAGLKSGNQLKRLLLLKWETSIYTVYSLQYSYVEFICSFSCYLQFFYIRFNQIQSTWSEWV